MTLASIYAQTEAALEACLTAQAAGAQIVEYEIGARRIRRQDLSIAIRELTRSLKEIRPLAIREGRGGAIFDLGEFAGG